MRVGIVGSRDWPNSRLDVIEEYVNTLPDTDVVVSGGARGVDRYVARLAKKRGLLVVEFEADWDGPLKKRAGFARNQKIVDNCDRLVAFHSAESRGTADTIKRARKRGIPIEVFED